MRLAFMSSATAGPRRSDFPDISSVFSDRITLWVGYPMAEDPVAYRPTLYLSERCRLARLFEEMHSLIFNDTQQSTKTVLEFAGAVDGLSEELRNWEEHLPMNLAYEWPMSIAVWELQSVTRFAYTLLWSHVTNNHL